MLEGRLIFHDGIRPWFELKLAQPQCGEASIQLLQGERNSKSLEILRGCRIKSDGALGFSPTGYYSLGVYQSVQQVEPLGACVYKSPLPDAPSAKPDKAIREYRVEMHVNYRPGDHPILFRVSHAGNALRPWQAYGRYFLTGGFILYGMCGEGFVLDKVFGTPQANPGHLDETPSPIDMAMFDLDRAAVSGKHDLHLGFTCIRP